MGWFDDSDDSEDERRKRKKRPLETFQLFDDGASNNKDSHEDIDGGEGGGQMEMVNQGQGRGKQQSIERQEERDIEGGNENGDDEVDPLDAFMNDLSKNNSSSSKTESNTIRESRLDMDNEDEATAHWKISKTATTNDASATTTAERKERNHSSSSSSPSPPQSLASMNAKAAMSSTFHKAGQKKKTNDDEDGSMHHGIDTGTKMHVENDEEHYKLEKVNHNKKQYPPFRKVFLFGHDCDGHDERDLHGGERKRKRGNGTNFGRSWREENEVSCSIDDIDPILSFQEYGGSIDNGDKTSETSTGTSTTGQWQEPIFDREVLRYLEKNNFKKATLVQSQSIPIALCGRDLIVTSHTGSGKTLAYLLPLVTHVLDQPHIQPKVDGPIGIILTPTRELAKQVHLIAKKLLHVVNGKAVSVTGGMGSYEMTKELQKGCEVVISTPGRFIDMVKKKATNCDRITFVVLDEADKMLDMGFEKQVGCILDSIRPDRQTLMFSATFGKKVERVAKGWLSQPVRIAVGRTGTSSEHVEQHVLVLPSYESKKIWLAEMLPILAGIGKMIIFVASRADRESITKLMRESPDIGGKGLLIDSIHGDRRQSDRNAALASLRKGKLAALVATDVASRGLDVDDIQTVINFDAAKNLDSHVHRIGRAGRLNRKLAENEHKKGVAYTLLTHKNADFAKILMEAFEREGREVSDELFKLAMKSKHYGAGKQKWDKGGLGFDSYGNNSSYYGPTDTTKQTKNSR